MVPADIGPRSRRSDHDGEGVRKSRPDTHGRKQRDRSSRQSTWWSYHRRVRARAVAVVIDRGEVLVIRRHKNGREYTVLPGGGVEIGESHEEACLRELMEETGLRGTLRAPLAVGLDETGPASYFRVTVDSRSVALGDPEISRVSPENRYEPQWVPLESLDLINLVPPAASSAIAAARKVAH